MSNKSDALTYMTKGSKSPKRNFQCISIPIENVYQQDRKYNFATVK